MDNLDQINNVLPFDGIFNNVIIIQEVAWLINSLDKYINLVKTNE